MSILDKSKSRSIRKIFLSYSHADEWLKDELLNHLAPQRASNGVYVWHDRLIIPGMKVNEEIDAEINSCDYAIFLLSSDFFSSQYCIGIEYKIARERAESGNLIIIPVVVRKCDWMNFGLNEYNALPTDGKAVADETMQREDNHKRDAAWLQVAKGIKSAISNRTPNEESPKISEDFLQTSSLIEFVRHPSAEQISEQDILVDPEIYDEDKQIFISSFEKLAARIFDCSASLIVGGARSGKSVIAKQLFRLAEKHSEKPLLLLGSDIKNIDILTLIRKEMTKQYDNSDHWLGDLTIILDDFEECILGDRSKAKIISTIHNICKKCVIISISPSSSLIYAAPELPNVNEFTIQDFTKAKLALLVDNWAALTEQRGSNEHDNLSSQRYDLVSRVFNDTGLPVRPYTAVTFLELAETASARDIQVTSFASCYDALITHRLLKNGIPPQQIDEAKNFISHLAYQLFIGDTGSPIGDPEILESALTYFDKEYLSDKTWLRNKVVPQFLSATNGDLKFNEPYLWYFLVARQIAGSVRRTDKKLYHEYVAKFAENVHKKTYANILIYVAYFANDEAVLEFLVIQTEEFFSKAARWTIADDRRAIMLNIGASDRFRNFGDSDGALSERVTLLQTNVSDILEDAEKSVSCYTTPGTGLPHFEETIDAIPDGSALRISRDSYQHHVNALIRLHSVIGHILQARSGSYSANRVVETIDAMVRASGRYADLNQSVAALIQLNDPEVNEDINEVDIIGISTFSEKKERLIRLFGFWSVYTSQAGLARYLSGEHTVRALKKLALVREIDAENPERAFNFSSCYVVASLISKNSLDEEFLDKATKKFGKESAFFAFARAATFNQSHYLKIGHAERQRIETKLNFSSNKLLRKQV